MNDEKEVVCSGRTLTPLLLGVFFWFIGVGVFLILISSTSKGVKGAVLSFSYYVEWKEAISYCFGVTKESL